MHYFHTISILDGVDIPFQVVRDIGPTWFAAIVCDSTSNTQLARELLENNLPVTFNIPDICHHIGNMIKNIINISYFQKVLQFQIDFFLSKIHHKLGYLNCEGVISKFHKSHIGVAELNLARKEAGIKHGLEAISKT